MQTIPTLDFTPIPVASALPAAPVRPVPAADEEAAAIQERDDAFSEAPVWNGKLLEPFTIERYLIFLSQRTSLGAPRLYQAMSDGNAFYPDALRILWLCSHDSSTIQLLRTDPEDMQNVMEKWAEENAPLHLTAQAVTVAIRIHNAARTNRADPRHTAASSHARPDDSGN
jgi:hypothetical protein